MNGLFVEKKLSEAKKLISSGKSSEALDVYNSILTKFPNNKRVQAAIKLLKPDQKSLDLLLLFFQKGNYKEAKKLALLLTEKFPEHPFCWKALGSILQEMGNSVEAIIAFQKSIKLSPNDIESYSNLGATLLALGRFKEAEVILRKATKLNPDFAQSYNNLGIVLKELLLLEEAEIVLKKAIKLNQNFAEAFNNLGLTQHKLGKYKEAEISYKEAIKIKPHDAGAYSNLGNTLQGFIRHEEAKEFFSKAVNLQPMVDKYHHNKNLCLNYSLTWEQSFIYKEHIKFEKYFGGLKVRASLDSKNFNYSKKKLNIGYVSGDFRTHSVSYFFEQLLKYHNSNFVKIYCYYNNTLQDETTMRIRSLSDHWRTIYEMPNDDVVDLIKKDNIDILVDLSGHTANNRLLVFAQKPAPIQVSWLGYPNTTGLSAIDYRFTDIIADPEGVADLFHSEKLIRLPNGFQCYKGDNDILLNTNLPLKKNGYITFASFNNFSKMTREVIKVWSKILIAIPNSKLILKSSKLNSDADHYLSLFNEEGIDDCRIQYYERLTNKEDHLKLYDKIDVGLDTFCFNGATTTCEALWMGVPVITLSGDRHAGRVGASILTNIGLTEFIAKDIEGYIGQAINIANNGDYLQDIRKNLRKKMLESPLCKGKSFARDIENAYQDMWIKYHKKSS